MTLRDLKPGDRFFPASQITKKLAEIFQVAGDRCEFNRAAGTATRKCIDPDGKLVDKQCKLEVCPVENPPPEAPEMKQSELF